MVYGELDFDGDEIYFTEQPSLVGRTYFDAQLAFPKCVAMGLEKGGDVILNPSPEAVIEASDRIIVIAEDDSLIALGEPGVADTASLAHAVPVSLAPESTLVLGTNAGLAGMLGELSEYVASGSTVRVVSASEPELPQFENLSAVWTQGDPTKRAVL